MITFSKFLGARPATPAPEAAAALERRWQEQRQWSQYDTPPKLRANVAAMKIARARRRA